MLLVACGEYFLKVWHSFGLAVENILKVRHFIGRMWRIFSNYGILLVNSGEHLQYMSLCWSQVENIPITLTLLVACGEYSQCQAVDWSHVENILIAYRFICHI
jgi:hypothetical protein